MNPSATEDPRMDQRGAPFGGYRQSGLGREESKDELLQLAKLKHVNVVLAECRNGHAASRATPRPA